MRLKIVGMLAIVLSLGFVANAQEEEGFTDEDLTKYATVMKWADAEKKKMGADVGVWVKENENIGGTKYNELNRANKKGELESAEATEEELAAFNEIQTKIDDSKAAFKETYTTKIKEDIGAGLYNRLRKALKADEELKGRYDAILAAVELPAEEEAEATEAGEESAGGK